MQELDLKMFRWLSLRNGLQAKDVLVMMLRCFGSMSLLSSDAAAFARFSTLVKLPTSTFITGSFILKYSIANDNFMATNPGKVKAFLTAAKRATDYVLASPAEAYKTYISIKPEMASAVNTKIFERSYAYFSKDLKNVQRDWEKVTKYGKRLGVLDESFKMNYTNSFLEWQLEGDSADPTGDQKRMAKLQKEGAANGGFQRLDVKATA